MHPAAIMQTNAARAEQERRQAHTDGMLAGTVYALPTVLPNLFGGQRNIGGLGDCGLIHAFKVRTSDYFEYTFPTEELALGFIAAHRQREAA